MLRRGCHMSLPDIDARPAPDERAPRTYRRRVIALLFVGVCACASAVGGPLPWAAAERTVAADDGMTPEQQFQRALRLLDASSSDRDFVKGLVLLRRAAERGSLRAESNLGVLYAEGRRVPADSALSVFWLHKAALGGWPEGQLNFGLACMTGRGIARDPVEATKWFLRAARQGNAEAEFNLGVAYARGDGVSSDVAEAYRWIQRSAQHGYLPAKALLGAAPQAEPNP